MVNAMVNTCHDKLEALPFKMEEEEEDRNAYIFCPSLRLPNICPPLSPSTEASTS